MSEPRSQQDHPWGVFPVGDTPEAEKFQRDHIVGIGGTQGEPRVSVNHDAAPVFERLLHAAATGLDGRREPYQLTGPVPDDWGYNPRLVRDSTVTASEHAGGLAVDLNASTNMRGHQADGGMKTEHADVPAWLVEYAEKDLGLVWGGRWVWHETAEHRTEPDPMHFQIKESPAEVHERIQWLERPDIVSCEPQDGVAPRPGPVSVQPEPQPAPQPQQQPDREPEPRVEQSTIERGDFGSL